VHAQRFDEAVINWQKFFVALYFRINGRTSAELLLLQLGGAG